MKLLSLRFSNLNSLYGTWSIDFEHRDYVANGLFAITGPTGAGKSTILDAISLALYGKTPRLGTITNSANEIMSRDCADCFAEVTFQSSKGKFRAHWSQRRARSKANGNLQAPQHELVDAVKERVITAKKMETSATILDCVGLDYEQFMRSIMLAQGEFAAFLKSEDSKRASILAKITGTDIYARIGTAVYQRFQSESQSLASISLQSSAIELLSESAIVAIHVRIQGINSALDNLQESRTKVERAIRWLERFDQLQHEILSLREECKTATLAAEEAIPFRKRFERSQRALPLQRSLENLQNLQARIAASQKSLEEKQIEIVNAESGKAETLQSLEQSRHEMAEIQREIESCRPIWLATRDLDLQIENADSRLGSTREQSKSIELKRQQLQQDKTDLESKLREKRNQLSRVKSYQVDNHCDDEITGLLPKIEYLVAEYNSKSEQVREVEFQLSAISRESSQVVVEHSEATERLAWAEQAVVDRQREIANLESRRSTTLAGESVDALQAEAEASRVSQQALLDHVRTIETILELDGEARSKFAEHDRLKQIILEHQTKLEQIDKQIEKQKQLVAALEASFFKDQLIAQLHEHRARLVAGQPCELCGSTDHPWANEGKPVTIGDSIHALNHAKEELAQYVSDRETSNRIADLNIHQFSQLEEAIHALEELRKLRISECEKHAARFQLDFVIALATVESGKQSIERLQQKESELKARISDANTVLELVAKKQAELSEILASKSTAEQALQSFENTQKNLEESRQRIETTALQNREVLNSKREALAAILERLRLAWPEDLATIRIALQARSNAWLAAMEEAAAFEKDLLLTEGSVASLLPQIDQWDNEGLAIQKTYATQSNDLEALRNSRNDLFGIRDPKAAEDELKLLLDQKGTAAERLTTEYEPLVATWQHLDRQILQIETSLLTDTEQLTEQKMRLEVDLLSAGFADFLDLESAIQSQSEMEESSRRLHSIDEAVGASKIRLAQKEVERDTWNDGRPSDATLEVLQQELSDVDCAIEGLRRERVELQHQISENEAKAERLQGAQLQLATQQKRFERWSVLNELIGSADGGKFRKFAQGITFELLLAYANIQLTRLTDRYLLKKGEEGLSLVVIDHYQSSRSRSAANLSGGESFLVSLALALGLSKLASQNVQIDSLFLDEGFGTLDEETLEEALHTLSSLRQEGKLVGLISHVAAINQQVPVRIEVIKGSMGRSRLVGPGVQ